MGGDGVAIDKKPIEAFGDDGLGNLFGSMGWTDAEDDVAGLAEVGEGGCVLEAVLVGAGVGVGGTAV